MKMLTTNEVAERLGVTVQRIHQFIKENRLPAQKMGRDYLIDEDDLKHVADRPTGRPPKSVKTSDLEMQTKTTRKLNPSVKRDAEKAMGNEKRGGKK